MVAFSVAVVAVRLWAGRNGLANRAVSDGGSNNERWSGRRRWRR